MLKPEKDTTNGAAASPGGPLSGELTRQYAVKRLQMKENRADTPVTARLTPPPGPLKLRKF
jgi:hypothetical protein